MVLRGEPRGRVGRRRDYFTKRLGRISRAGLFYCVPGDKNHESGYLFDTWQYDVRWVALVLRTGKVVKTAQSPPKGVWELALTSASLGS